MKMKKHKETQIQYSNQEEAALEIKSLESKLLAIFEQVKVNPSFHQYVQKTYQTSVKKLTLEETYDKTIKEVEDRMIFGYRNRNFSIIKSMISFEERVWSFVENNPEQWLLMTEKIIWPDSETIYTFNGFSFVYNFIHNGVWDDWEINIVEKDNEVFFIDFDCEEKDEYKKQGYTINYLNQKNLEQVLNKLENKNVVKIKM